MVFDMDLNLLKTKTDEINEIVMSYLPESGGFDEKIISAMSYSLSAGGKRIRPLLMSESFDIFAEPGKSRNTLNAFMAALEYIHTYSLVHDDLPAMDDAELRRGKPATHVRFGEAFGVLAGDALLNRAFEIVAKAMMEITDKTDLLYAQRAFYALASRSGVSGMIGGQSLDVESEKAVGFELSKSHLDYIYQKKTGALIQAALTIGATLANAKFDEIEKMEVIGTGIGYAFQIQDDILDIEGSREELGKDVGADSKNNKKTYVDFVGMDAAKTEVKRYTEKAIEDLESLKGRNTGFLKELLIMLVSRKK